MEKYQGLREEQEKMLVVKKTVLPVVIRAQGAVTDKLGEWLQKISRATSEVSVQKSATIEAAESLNSQVSGRGPDLEEETSTPTNTVV